jgi:hypothetical protein
MRAPDEGNDTSTVADSERRVEDDVVGEAHWPMAGAVLAAMVLTLLLPDAVQLGPNWVLALIDKIAMAVQSVISLGILGLVIARAVNVFTQAPPTTPDRVDRAQPGLATVGICGRSGRDARPYGALTAGVAAGLRVQRDDGEELHAEVRCWDRAHAAAERAANTEALAGIADRGIEAALEYAELVESPATRGSVLISIWFDPADDGKLRRRVSYERASA